MRISLGVVVAGALGLATTGGRAQDRLDLNVPMFVDEPPLATENSGQSVVRNQLSVLGLASQDKALFDVLIPKAWRWDTGDVITVAFNGGADEVRRQIEQIASIWTKSANITFRFRDAQGKFLEWHESDIIYAAKIRIAFWRPDVDDMNKRQGFDRSFGGGYWSVIAKESVTPQVRSAGQASMNFGGAADTGPYGWQGIVVHEFGHVLGAGHELQNINGHCEAQMQWEPEPGYQDTTDKDGVYLVDKAGKSPGIYKWMSGPPNKWDKPKIDAQVRHIVDSRAWQFGKFDAVSIMSYYYPTWFYKQPAGACYHPFSEIPSPGDEQAVAGMYRSGQVPMAAATIPPSAALSVLLQSVPANSELAGTLRALSLNGKASP